MNKDFNYVYDLCLELLEFIQSEQDLWINREGKRAFESLEKIKVSLLSISQELNQTPIDYRNLNTLCIATDKILGNEITNAFIFPPKISESAKQFVIRNRETSLETWKNIKTIISDLVRASIFSNS